MANHQQELISALWSSGFDRPTLAREPVARVGFNPVIGIDLIGKQQIKALTIGSQHDRIEVTIGVCFDIETERIFANRKLLGCFDLNVESAVALGQDVLKGC